ASSKRMPRSIICCTRAARSSRIMTETRVGRRPRAFGQRDCRSRGVRNVGHHPPWALGLSYFEIVSGESLVRFQILLACGRNHIIREGGDGRLFVPANLLEMVPDELFVEARLTPAWLVVGFRPEAR